MSKELLEKQVSAWRKEVARLNDFIASATGTQTAANKAAEEGELPTPRAVMDVVDEFGSGTSCYIAEDLRKAIAAAIAADRAARPVANKAEVDLSSLRTFYGVQETPGFKQCHNGAYVLKADVEALLATPPATTGASTVLTDERIDIIINKLKPDDTYEDLRNFAREVAAQAGQVAVPGDLIERAAKLVESHAVVDEDDSEDSKEEVVNWVLRQRAAQIRSLAAPSPAKESK